MQRNSTLNEDIVLIPVPASLFLESDIPLGCDLDVSIEKGRIVIGATDEGFDSDDEDFDDTENEDEDDCEGCPLRCPECGACLYELLEAFGVDMEEGAFEDE